MDAVEHGDEILVSIFNRGRRKIRIDRVDFWYGNADFYKGVLSERVDLVLDESASFERGFSRAQFLEGCRTKGIEVKSKSYLRFSVRYMRDKVAFGVVELDQSRLGVIGDQISKYEHKRDITANLFLGFEPVPPVSVSAGVTVK